MIIITPSKQYNYSLGQHEIDSQQTEAREGDQNTKKLQKNSR